MHHITPEKEHHNGHRNEEEKGFDHCVPVMVHAESEEEAKEIAQTVTEQFGSGDDCPNCGTEMEKPRAGKVECPNCEWVVNGQNQGYELRRYNLTFRQASRLLQLFGYDRPATPGNAGNALGKLCLDHEIEREELNDVLDDLRGNGAYGE